MARANLDQGVDWIKVLATERAGTADTDPRKQVYTEAELRAVVEEAATEASPCRPTRTAPKALWPRCAPGCGASSTAPTCPTRRSALMKEKGTYLVPTYTTVDDLTEPGGDYDVPALALRGRHMLPRLRATCAAPTRWG